MLVASRVMSSRVKSRVGKVTTCPAAVRDASVRSTVTGDPPSKRSVARVIHRLGESRNGWIRRIRSVRTGSVMVIARRCPTGLVNAPTRHMLSRLSSTAPAGRSDGL